MNINQEPTKKTFNQQVGIRNTDVLDLAYFLCQRIFGQPEVVQEVKVDESVNQSNVVYDSKKIEP